MRRRNAYLIFALTLAIVAVLFLYPLGMVIKGGFIDENGEVTSKFVVGVFRNPIYAQGLLNSLGIALGTTALVTLIRNDPRTAHLPVVIYSAISDEKMIDQARRHGANDFWVKVKKTAPTRTTARDKAASTPVRASIQTVAEPRSRSAVTPSPPARGRRR